MRRRVFIGSSSEGLQVAYAIQKNLEKVAESTVWTQGVFNPSEFVLESLTERLKKSDAGIFVFSSEDVVKMRGAEYASVRDNVLFEYGLFVGHLGKANTFIVAPSDVPLRLPSDLSGLNYITYISEREDRNYLAALAPACYSLELYLIRIDPMSKILPKEFDLSFGERRNLLGDLQREILFRIEALESVTLGELKQILPGLSHGEIAYRLEHLRLQMFIRLDEQTVGTDDQTYRISEHYKDFERINLGRYHDGSHHIMKESMKKMYQKEKEIKVSKK